MLSFHSFLAEPIQHLIDLRRLCGADYHSQATLLELFDRFLVEHASDHQPRLTRALIEAYQRSLASLAPRSRQNRMCVVRQLCRYLAVRDPSVYVPEAMHITPSTHGGVPYLYSPEEIRALLDAATALPPPGSLRPHTHHTLIGLLYSTGIRIGEAMALNLEHFHPDQQRLFIASGKFHKARWIPLTPSTHQVLVNYVQHRLSFAPAPGNAPAPLFINLRGRRLRHCNVAQTFHRILRDSSIALGRSPSPRIHDLRHTFAVSRLLAWYREGVDIQARLPLLATYLGHVNILSTQHYLHPTAELLALVDQRFHDHFLARVQSEGDSS